MSDHRRISRARPEATATRRRRCSCPDAVRSVDLPSFVAVVDAAAAAEVTLGVLPIESSLIGPIAETHDLLFRCAAFDRPRGDAADPTLRRRPRRRKSRRAHEPCARIRLRSTSAVTLLGWRDVRRVPAATTADAAREVADTGDPRQVAIASAEAAAAYGLEVLADDVGDQPRRLHPLRRARAVHAGRRRRGLANGAVFRHRPPARSAVPRARPIGAERCQPRAARVASAPELAVALSLRPRARRPRLRPARAAHRLPSYAG